jgi:hypothetical protein
VNRGAVVLPLACCAACPGFLAGGPGAGVAVGAVTGTDRFRAGQAAAAGGPQAAASRVSHSCARCQPFRQVQGEVAAAVPGGAGGHRD